MCRIFNWNRTSCKSSRKRLWFRTFCGYRIDGCGTMADRAKAGRHVGTNAECGVSPRTAQAAMRHSKIDMTMNVYTDPRWLDVHGALDTLPTLDLNSSSKSNQQSLRATGTDCRDFGPASIYALSFVAPDVAPTSGKPGHFESFPVTLGSPCDDENHASGKPQRSSKPNKKASFAGDANKAFQG